MARLGQRGVRADNTENASATAVCDTGSPTCPPGNSREAQAPIIFPGPPRGVTVA
ncbi:hypothetical protein MMEU_2614 [Mycobacterium marinum str. Europe]|nr:hypothetical protein MMEU_2614 [Mycobacterium marinum str. Europe]